MLERLLALVPLRITLVSTLGPALWPAALAKVTTWVDVATDAGVVQSDDVTVDDGETASRLSRWAREEELVLARETARLSAGVELMLADVPALPLQAAARCGVPCAALANFSWDWIYARLGYDAAAERCARSYAHATVLLAASPCAPMAAFPHRIDVGLVARRSMVPRPVVRERLGVPEQCRLVLLALRSHSHAVAALPPSRRGFVFAVDGNWPTDRADVVRIPDDIAYIDVIASSDIVVGKPGYGLIGDVAASGTRLLYVERPGFPENDVLVTWLRQWGGAESVTRDSLQQGKWLDVLESLDARPAPPAVAADGARIAAEHLASMIETR